MFDRSTAQQYDDFRAIPDSALSAIQSRVIAAAGLRPGARVLELGAGTGRIGRGFSSRGFRYTGLDTSRAMLTRFHTLAVPLEHPALVQASAVQLPFATGCFDLVLLVQVLGVVPGWRRALAECQRVLVTGGRAVVGRVEHAPGSLQVFVRAERIRRLAEEGIEVRRPGAEEDQIVAALSTSVGPVETLPSLTWQAETDPRTAVEANLSGWRVQSLPLEQQARLREQLLSATAKRYASLDRPIQEERTFALVIASHRL